MRSSMRLLWMRALAAAALTAGWLLSIPAANAQVESPSPGLSEQTPQTPNIPDQKLDATAAALQQVASVKKNYEEQIEAAARSDKKRIADEVRDALVKAVTDQGLSVEEYTSILMLAQNDPGVREKLVQRLHPSAK